MKDFQYYQTSKIAYFSKEDQNRYKAELKVVIGDDLSLTIGDKVVAAAAWMEDRD